MKGKLISLSRPKRSVTAHASPLPLNKIVVANDVGSKEFMSIFPSGTAKLGTLRSADFRIQGICPLTKTRTLIGIERKTLPDFLSSIRKGRLWGHQIRRMQEQYKYRFLVLEGLYRFNVNGLVETFSRGSWYELEGVTAAEIEGALISIGVIGGFHIWHTAVMMETAGFVMEVNRWFEKSTHHSHESISFNPFSETIALTRPTLCTRMAAQIGGIGAGKAREVGQHFETAHRMIRAHENAWRQVPGIGRKIAKEAYEALRRRKD